MIMVDVESIQESTVVPGSRQSLAALHSNKKKTKARAKGLLLRGFRLYPILADLQWFLLCHNTTTTLVPQYHRYDLWKQKYPCTPAPSVVFYSNANLISSCAATQLLMIISEPSSTKPVQTPIARTPLTSHQQISGSTIHTRPIICRAANYCRCSSDCAPFVLGWWRH